MITLKNNLPHKADTAIKVQGEVYHIGADGMVNVSPDHAKILLQNDAYQKVTAKKRASKKIKKEPVLVDKVDEPQAEPEVIDNYAQLSYNQLRALCIEKDIELPDTDGRVKRTIMIELLEGANT